MLPKKERLANKREINRVLRIRSYQAKGKLIDIIGCENTLPYPRLVVIAPKKIGNAVKRNRAKRLISEVFVALKPKIAHDIDLAVFAKKNSPDTDFLLLKSELLSLLIKQRLIRDENNN